MEKIIFDEKTFVYRANLDLSEFKDEMIEECKALCTISINNGSIRMYPGADSGYMIGITQPESIEIVSKLDRIIQFGINSCTSIYKSENMNYDSVFSEYGSFILVNQTDSEVKTPPFHSHYEINKRNGGLIPYYTYVYYIQMPDKLKGNDAVLEMQSETGEEYSILPREGDLIIMRSDVFHRPTFAYNGSDKDRVIVVGNVGFELFSDEI